MSVPPIATRTRSFQPRDPFATSAERPAPRGGSALGTAPYGVETRIERPAYAWLAVALQVFTAVAAIPVGLEMVRNPDGAPLGLPQAWIDATMFGSYLLPGLFLFAINGIGQLVAATAIVLRHPTAPWLTGALGVGLMIWIAVQVAMMPFHPLQPIIFVVGLIETVVAAAWLSRRR
jgi:hypothetical protein